MSKTFQCYHCDFANTFNSIFCKNCNFIQPPLNIDFFSRLEMDISFDIDDNQLENSYLKLQKFLHPDLYINKTEIEKNFAFKHSLLLNQSYETLKSPLKRSEYILNLNDIQVNNNHKQAIKPSPELLHDIFELQNDIEEATSQQDQQHIMKQIENDRNEIYDALANSFKQRDYSAAAHLTIKLQFLEKL